mmetsp:Transcript_11828/g.28241  ORF Transcript_11828/g.28241 Transcript_11828/m.28241 type:complete len:338 (+) Transcript_11828:3-1016(+)
MVKNESMEKDSQEHEKESQGAKQKLKEEQADDWCMMLIQDERNDLTQPQQYSFLRFPHPRHGKSVLFVHANNNVLEIRRAGRQNFSCWFVGDYCQKDGDVVFATKIDPLFLALPILDKARNKTSEHAGRFCDKEQIFSSWPEHSADCMTLAASNGMDLHVICDVKEVGDDHYYRLNDDKVLAWARAKVQATSAFKYPDFDSLSWKASGEEGVASNADSVEEKIKKLARMDAIRCDRDKIMFGVTLVCDFLSEPCSTALLASYALEPKCLLPQKVVSGGGDENLKVHHGSGNGRSRDDADGPPTVKKAKLAQSKADKIGASTKGMQSLSAFFKPKPKA